MKENYIKSLKLKNFTAFDEIEFKFSPGVNVLIGANSTGKTHSLKVMYSVLMLYKGKKKKGSNESDIEEQTDTFFSLRHNLEDYFLPAEYNLGRLINYYPGRKHATISLGINDSVIEFEIVTKVGATSAPGLPTDIELEEPVVFIPAKEILSNAHGFIAEYEKRYLEFAKTYYDIIIHAYTKPLKNGQPGFISSAKLLENTIGGSIVEKDGRFYLRLSEIDYDLEFSLLAEGYSRVALLSLLLKNGSIEPGSILFWDEPESNLNPKMLREVVKVLLELQRHNVQIFLATHNYVLLKEFDLQMKKEDKVLFHSLYKEDDTIKVSSTDDYLNIEPNVISETYLGLLTRDLGREDID